MRRVGLGLGLLGLLLLGGLGSAVVHAQPDSARAALLKERGFSPDHSPRSALWRAAAVPGWGQLYNRQYYKLPFVYAGLAGGGYAIYEMNRRYLLYRHANLYKIGENQKGENSYQGFEDEYNRAVNRLSGGRGGAASGRQLRTLRDKYRRWRDLSILGTVLFHALTVIDAYVSAHLLTFDVGGVALRVHPPGDGQMAQTEGGPSGVPREGFPSPPEGAGLQVRVRF